MDFLIFLEYLGTFAAAASGIRLAATKHFDLFGAFVAGTITAIGGGTLRDIILGIPPFWLAKFTYLFIVILTLFAYVIFRKIADKTNNILLVLDAIGLAFFTVVGMQKAIDASQPLWVAIAMGTITGAAGGVLRDILLNEEPLILKRDIYAVACILGGIVFTIMSMFGLPSAIIQLGCATTVFLIRIFAICYNWQLPLLK